MLLGGEILTDMLRPLYDLLSEEDDPVQMGLLSSKGDPTMAGMALLADSRLSQLRGIGVHYRRWEAGMAEVQAAGLAAVEDFTAGGPLPFLIEELAEGMVDQAPRSHHDPLVGRRLFVELLVNALGHRSFAPDHLQEPVHVLQFRDRVTITSPGGLPTGVRCSRGTLRGRFSRNPSIMSALTKLGLAHQQNLGLEWARKLAPELGYRLEHSCTSAAVTATLEVNPEDVLQPGATTKSKARRSRVPMKLLEERILEEIDAGGVLSRRRLQRSLGVPLTTLRQALDSLLERGAIEMTEASPRSPQQRYRRHSRGRHQP